MVMFLTPLESLEEVCSCTVQGDYFEGNVPETNVLLCISHK
jgi:hypothetical protein